MDLGAVGQVLLLSAAPISELRGGLPFALSLGFSPATAYVVAVVGNLLPVPLLLFGLSALVPSAGRIPGPLGRAARRYLTWQETRHRARFAKFGEWALVLFVAIPLPVTGAWTGSLLAVLFGIPWRRALLMLVFGVLLAGGIVLLASLGVIAVL